eukprot:CAMPEP_0196713150 /NCGR_PEP_ID=MMETSP1090-20130531/75067_1 /TAXON_ID=37098 /ORGANISM="Isochrysis sp, Strain CCMP1244" /LENGTH=198 /DNA_ID=CAMNT_0042053249 /DNA_START=201 /DNA_END=797 /DNA_ORIENTATION=-
MKQLLGHDEWKVGESSGKSELGLGGDRRAACAEIDMVRRPSSSARACGSVEGGLHARRGGGAPDCTTPGDHGKSGSLIRSTALLPRSKLGTRHTPDDMYSPTRQPAKRCREPVAFAAADRGDRARRVRGDRHGEAAVIPYDAAGASARACGSVEGSTLGAAEVRRTAPLPHHPDSERCSSYENRAGVCISYEEACAVI